jgi:AraC family transcriptional regulator of adaptative response / DNA-3-methyladenine glycosylase II
MARALDARDPRFDGLFFVGITTTGIYCRSVCPARISHPSRRRFFASAAAAEQAGFRPCRRCRPELAPGRSAVDAIPRLVYAAEQRIAAGALNERSVAELAHELGVSERHLRRAVTQKLGVSPIELAQTHRLLLAKQLLSDTALSVTRVAYASGFQSLRRFNAAFRSAYRMAPSAVRRREASRQSKRQGAHAAVERVPLRLTLSYRPPLAWKALLARLAADTVSGVDAVVGRCYTTTVSLDGHAGMVLVADAATLGRHPRGHGPSHLVVELSETLVPVLMPLLGRLRHLFDLDAEPAVIDAHLADAGLTDLVAARRGLRVPGSLDGFDVAMRLLLCRPGAGALAATLGARLQDPREIGGETLTHVMPDAARVAEAGVGRIAALGIPRAPAERIIALARLVADGALRLEPGGNLVAAADTLASLPDMEPHAITSILMRALSWPDAFPATDPRLLAAAGARDPSELLGRAERWRPWRAYAAMHLLRAAARGEKRALAPRSTPHEERSAG